jgi:hypothetical protein
MPGFDNNTVYATNLDFTGNATVTPQVTTNGQLLIGSTVAPNIRVGTLTGTDGSISVSSGAGTLNVNGTQATSAQKGSVTLASNAETIAGTDTSKVVTPDDLKAKLGVQTANGLLIGEGTAAAVASMSAGSAGQIVRSSGAAVDPAWTTATFPATTAAGEVLLSNSANTVTSGASLTGNFTYTTATAGTERILTVSNSDNTNAASAATLKLTTGGASAGDPKTQYSTTTTSWSAGIDNSATLPTADPYVISQGTTLGTNNAMVIGTGGTVNFPLTPAFLAQTTDQLNVTGDNTTYTVTFNTEIFDQSSSFDGVSTFTAPVTGRYYFTNSLSLGDFTTSHTNSAINFITSNRSYELVVVNMANVREAANFYNLSASTLADMDAGDTLTLTINVSGGTKVVDINAVNGRLSGFLVC